MLYLDVKNLLSKSCGNHPGEISKITTFLDLQKCLLVHIAFSSCFEEQNEYSARLLNCEPFVVLAKQFKGFLLVDEKGNLVKIVVGCFRLFNNLGNLSCHANSLLVSHGDVNGLARGLLASTTAASGGAHDVLLCSRHCLNYSLNHFS